LRGAETKLISQLAGEKGEKKKKANGRFKERKGKMKFESPKGGRSERIRPTNLKEKGQKKIKRGGGGS